MNYYSQIGQDRYFIEEIIKECAFGRFLDIGAHDGIFTSNTYALEQLGWTGICIEANPTLAEQCRANRPNSLVLNAAVWSEEKEVVFELPSSGNSLLSRIGGIAHNDNYFAADFEKVEKLSMVAKPIKTLIGNGPHLFDYFSLDVEGAELEALKGIDWTTTRFNYIALEFGHRLTFLDEIKAFLASKGYRLHRINDFDADFVPQ